MNDKKTHDTIKTEHKGLRTTVNSIMVIAIICISAAAGYTISDLKVGSRASNNFPAMSEQRQQSNDGRTRTRNNHSSNSESTRPEMPSSTNNNTNSSQQQNNTPPEMPSGEDGGTPPDFSQNGTPPEMPTSESDNTRPTNPLNQESDKTRINRTKNSELSAANYITFATESLIVAALAVYLIASDFNRKSPKEVFKDANSTLTLILTLIIATGVLFGTEILLVNIL